MDLHVLDVQLQTVKIYWNPLSLPLPLMIQDINQTYTLTVTSSNIQPLVLQLNQLSYIFTAPEGTPPCEVYNISIIATYHDIAGITYTGDDCSVASSVRLLMLPSLPDIRNLESSLYYTLRKNTTGNITLKVSFSVSIS